MRRRRFVSLDGWNDWPLTWGVRHRTKVYEWDDSYHILYEPITRKVWAEGHFKPDWLSPVDFTTQRERYVADLLKAALEARKKAVKVVTAYEPEGWFSKIPLIEAMLKQASMDGKPRRTSTLNLSLGTDGCKVMLKDRQSHEVTWGTGESFLDALVALEERLAEGTAQWQEDNFAEGNGKKK